MKWREKREKNKLCRQMLYRWCIAKQCISSATPGVLRFSMMRNLTEKMNFEGHCRRWRCFFFASGGRLSSLRSSSPADVTFNQTVTQFPGARWESCLSLTDATLWRELMSGSRISLIPTSQQTSRNRITATVPVRSVIFLCRNHPLMATPALT